MYCGGWMTGYPRHHPRHRPQPQVKTASKEVFKERLELAKQRDGEALFQVKGAEQAKTLKDE